MWRNTLFPLPLHPRSLVGYLQALQSVTEKLLSQLPRNTRRVVVGVRVWQQKPRACKPSAGYDHSTPIAHVRYIKILTWLQGLLVISLYWVWFSLCLSLFWELPDNRVVKKIFNFDPKPRSHVIILIYRTWAIPHFRSERGAGTEMCPAIVHGIVTGDVPVRYWPIFPLPLVTVPGVLAKVNST